MSRRVGVSTSAYVWPVIIYKRQPSATGTDTTRNGDFWLTGNRADDVLDNQRRDSSASLGERLTGSHLRFHHL